MKTLISIMAMLFLSVSGEAKNISVQNKGRDPSGLLWTPVSYEKIILSKKVPEGLIFVKNGFKDKLSYSASYFVGGQVLRTRVVPREIYQSMKERLRSDVLAHVRKDFSAGCSNQILLADGVINNNGKTHSAKEKKVTPICLQSSGRDSRVTQESFSRWYANARSMFGL